MENRLSKLIYICVVAVALTILMPTRVEAITNLNQKTAKKTSATITWKKSAGEASYQVEYKKSTRVWNPSETINSRSGEMVYKNAKTMKSKRFTKTSFNCSGLQAGRVYEVKVRAFNKFGKEIKSAIKTIEVKTLPGNTEILSAAYSSEVVGENKSEWLSDEYFADVEFLLQDSADGYEMKILHSDGKIMRQRTFSQQEMKEGLPFVSERVWVLGAGDTGVGKVCFEGITETTPMYKVLIRAYQNYKGKKVYGAWGSGYALRQPIAQVRKNSDGSVQLRWNKNTEATGYDVYITDKKIAKNIWTQSLKTINQYRVKALKKDKTTIKLPKKYFEKGKTYHYLVTAKKKVGKKEYSTSIGYSYWLKFTY